MTKSEIFAAYFTPRNSYTKNKGTDAYMEELFKSVNAGEGPLTAKELLAPPIKITPLESDYGSRILLRTDYDEDYNADFMAEINERYERVWHGKPDAKWKMIGFRAYEHKKRYNFSVVCVPNDASVLNNPEFGTEEWTKQNRVFFPLYLSGTIYKFLVEFSERRAFIVESIEHRNRTLTIITEIINGVKTRAFINNNEWNPKAKDIGTAHWEVIEYCD